MSIEFNHDDCIKLMPELNGLVLDIGELKGGITNKLYRVQVADGRDYVFRFYGKKTDLFKPFPDIYWFLWSLIQLNLSTIEFDYYGYGKVKYDNARKNIDFLRNHYGVKT